MRKMILAVLITAVAVPAFAARGRDQSYITFDDGGTTIKQADDGRDVEGRVNMPVYRGDEVTTSRRGRAEIRLADGNILALDRSTVVRFESISNEYDGEGAQSVIELRAGHVAIHRTDEATEMLRVDTPNASYAATDESVYAVEVDSRGRDRVTVFAGLVEVRTPARSTRLRRGEEARIDDQGLYGLVNTPGGVADEFERWFVRRAERYGGATSRYLDRSLAYSDSDLSDNGSWVYSSSYGGYGWRPRVALGWRPYYHGRWGYGPGGGLTWISYESWGWVPYHYGRWSFDTGFGWLWLPGYTYAPAWVYWAYGPNYIGWAPSGWYDCYRPYYNWAYRPYNRAGFDFGFGFYGHVRLNEVDLRPWTFIHPNSIVSNRVDQAALTTDAVRQRLQRGGENLATVTGTPARFSRSELRDPVTAVNTIARRGLAGGAGRDGANAGTDMTPFFRRDADLSPTVRDRIVRSRAPEPISGFTSGSGVPSPGTPGTLEGRVGRDGGGSRGDTRIGDTIDRRGINRGSDNNTPQAPSTVQRGGTGIRRDRESAPEPSTDRTNAGSNNTWRDRIERAPAAPSNRGSVERTPVENTPSNERPQTDNNWRGRSVQRGGESGSVDRSGRSSAGEQRPATPDRVTDVPRRIIDRIGGARISPGESSREPSRDSSREAQPRSSTSEPRERSSSSQPRETARETPRAERSSPPPEQQRSSPPPAKSNDSGGKVRREHE